LADKLLCDGPCLVALHPGGADPLGRVLSVTGSHATIQVKVPNPPPEAEDERLSIGRFFGIRAGKSLVIGVLTGISVDDARVAAGYATGAIDLLGEIRVDESGAPRFDRGVKESPTIGDPAEFLGRVALRTVFDVAGPDTINIGQLQQDHSIGAPIDVDRLIGRHFAVLGTTGVGKSTGVAVILQEILQARPDLRMFVIDPHNEYGHCFGDRAQVLTPKNLRLPFWLFNFEETVDVFFRGRPGVEDEVEILSELIPIAKGNVAHSRGAADRPSIRKNDAKSTGYSLDTPVPYRLEELIGLIDERMGKLENRSVWTRYHRLLGRIESARNDPRYTFMFENANVGGDTMVDVLSQLFRLPPNGRPMTIMQLAGFPAEVVDCVVSVGCRMAFEFGLWSDGAFPLLMVCEEAHRYVPADRTMGFGPTRKAISRIAKEGRKYGVFLGLMTQRPSELDATIISQCNTLFAMRMANERDQAIVRSAVSDAAGSLIAFLPALGAREVFAFGDGVPLPTRLRFKELPEHLIPRREAVGHSRMDSVEASVQAADNDFISSVVERWRGATSNDKRDLDDAPLYDTLVTDDLSPLQQALARNPRRGGAGAKAAPVTRPDSFFFPVDTGGGRPGSRPRR